MILSKKNLMGFDLHRTEESLKMLLDTKENVKE